MKFFNYPVNRNRVVLLAIIVTLITCFTACKDEPFEFQLDRANALSFRLDTFDLVITSDVVFHEGPQVLHVFEDSSKVLFQRISLEARGLTPSSQEYWFIVDFDTHTDGDAVGKYTSDYDPENGGIDEMRIIVDNNGSLSEYRTVAGVNSVYFQVDAQKEDERIMKGVFGGMLFQDGNQEGLPSLITDGVFKDIKY